MACFVFVEGDNEYDGIWIVWMFAFELAGIVC